MMASSADESHCAACGKGGEGLKLMKCTACKTAEYCSRECQISHRRSHKKECKRLYDERLFQTPPLGDDCPICFLPLPLKGELTTYASCCGKIYCNGCKWATSIENVSSGNFSGCSFCRTPVHMSDEENLERLQKRVFVSNDAEACISIGKYFDESIVWPPGTPAKYLGRTGLLLKAADLGSSKAHFSLGNIYSSGDLGEDIDMKKALHYWELAAMEGHMDARYELGATENIWGKKKLAYKHWMIGACAGHDGALEAIKNGFKEGHVTKDDFAKALRGHQNATDEGKSEQRERALDFETIAQISQIHELSGRIPNPL